MQKLKIQNEAFEETRNNKRVNMRGENLQNSNQFNEGLCWRSLQKLKRQNEPIEEIHSNKSDKSMRGSSRNLQKQNRLL